MFCAQSGREENEMGYCIYVIALRILFYYFVVVSTDCNSFFSSLLRMRVRTAYTLHAMRHSIEFRLRSAAL